MGPPSLRGSAEMVREGASGANVSGVALVAEALVAEWAPALDREVSEGSVRSHYSKHGCNCRRV